MNSRPGIYNPTCKRRGNLDRALIFNRPDSTKAEQP